MKGKLYLLSLVVSLLFAVSFAHAQVASKAQVAKQLITSVKDADRPADSELSAMKLSVETYSRNNGVSHVYFQQFVGEIPVFNAIMGVHITRDNKLLTYNSRFTPLKSSESIASNPALTADQAVIAAINALGLRLGSPLVQKQPATGPIRFTVFDKGNVACEDIKVQLVYQPVEKQGLRLAWQVEIYTAKATDYWLARIDAGTGQLLDKNNLVVSCDFGVADNKKCSHGFLPHKRPDEKPVFQVPFFMKKAGGKPAENEKKFSPFYNDGSSYRVYAYPAESPNHIAPLPPADGRTTVANPSVTAASPFGWHDTNGAAGAEFTTTQGNNVHAYTDTDADNLPDAGSSPDGTASLTFVFPIDLTQPPSAYRPAAVTNLFYWNNFIHDFMYGYGFDEISGNFQVNNYGNGGLGNDDVRAEAQDGSGTNNANFSTPADGSRPRMQMYVGTNPTPDVDGDLDNLVIVHEYAHGISNRLTGGPANVSCLNNQEQMGEGWSDWYGLMMTMKPTDVGTTGRGVGTYLFGQPANGTGIRPNPYSTDMMINPATYDDIKTLLVPHGVGYVWASMIWDLTWKLIDKHGMTNGFNIAMNIVTEGMKLQPCSPGFVDGRNAIIAADQSLYAGANRCLIWEVFARRGLGFSASQGSSGSRSDGTEAFDLPTNCFVDAIPTTISVCAPTNAVATINVGDGYGGPVTLSATGNPAGTTVTFSTNPVTPIPGSSTMTIGNTGSAAPGTYNVTVSGTDGVLTYNDNFSLTIQAAPPAATSLVSPANGAVNVANAVLNWNVLAVAETYEVQVATDAGFTNIVASATGLTSPTFTPAGLINLTTYYWRTRAVNICGNGSYSSVFSFTTANIICGTTASTNVPVAISTSGTPTVTSTLSVASCGTITGVKVQNLNVTHTFVGDLRVTLTSPLGTVVTLFDRPGVPASTFGCSGDNLAVGFDDAAILTAANFESTCGNLPAISGTYQPVNLLSGFNGENMLGTWTLTVSDLATGDGGSLDSWQLEICSSPCAGAPTITTSGSLTPFTACSGNASAEQSFTVSGTDLTANLVVTAPADFEVSTTSGSGFGSSVSLVPSSGTVPATTIYVRMAATATGTPAGNIACTSTGATTQNVAVSGTVNALPIPTLSGPGLVCAGIGGNVYTTEASRSNYVWTVSAGGTVTAGGTSTDNTVTVTWNTAGPKTVSVSYTDANGCTAASPTSFNVSVAATPVPVISGPATACAGSAGNVYSTASGNANYIWTVSAGGTITAGGTLTDNTVTVTWNTTGPQTVSVNYNAPSGCTAPAATVYNVTVNPVPDVNAVSNQTLCNGASTTAVNFSGSVSGTVYNWTNDNTSIGLAANGSGNIASFAATNATNAPVTATITVTPSYTNNSVTCTGTPVTFTITVNPTPSINPVSNVTVCNGATTSPINFSGPVSGTMFNWTNNNPAIGLPASGTGNIAPFIAINPGVGPVSATITVTPVTNTAQATINFNYTGAVQSWIVPPGVTSINVQAFGAQGNSNALGVAGGLGGSATGTLAVTPGSTLYINVGGGGIVSATGGFNGGGNAGSSACASAIGGGGGGASDIRDGANTLGARVLVAAGGAGAGGNRVSGCGRGTGGGGGAGYYGGGGGAAWPNTSTVLPTGGTQAAGGTGGDSNWGSVPGNDGSPGGLGTGGNGGVEISSSQTANATALSGGGAGGGLTGANGIYGPNWTGQSGAGGSSYIGGVTSGSTISGVQAGNGSVIISYIAPVTPVICTGTPITFTITVNPTPTITCPANVVANSTPGQCGAIVTYPAATATGVPAPTITYSHPSGSFFPVGVTTVTATATNSCGTVTCTFTVTVNDVQPPVITCPANITVGNDPGLCSAVVNYALPSASDNCNKLQVPQTILAHGGGAITFAGNNAPGGYYFNITNNSATPKTISSLSVRFGTTSVGGAVPSPAPVSVYVTTSATTYVGNQTNAGAWTAIGTGIPVTVAGPNSEFSLVPLPNGGFTLAPGQSKGMYVLGTVSSLLYNSAANSNTTPISNGVLTVTPGQASSGLFTAGASPRIPNIIINYITLTQTAGLPSGSVFPVGTTTNTYTATDDAGNTSSCSFTVRVNDTQAPTITCPGNITVTSPAGSCTAVVTYAATANDNCPGVTVQVVSGPASGSAFPVGTTTVTLRAVDAAGNVSANCSFTVTVLDGQLPVITAQPQNRTVCAGQSATFSVTAITSPNANGPLSYQWQSWNGTAWVDISGATASSYTVSNTTVSQNTNSYRVRVIGLCTTITSNHATLYVNPNPTVTLTTNIPPAILPTQSVTITAVPSIAGGSYQWYKNGVLIAGATNQTLGPLTVADIGSYRVVYTAPTGCVGTSADLAVTGLATPNLYVYPNPNRGQFTVQFYNQSNEEVTLRIFDAKGALVYQRKYATTLPYTNINVNLADGRILTAGVYVVDVLDSGGRQIGTRRIIVYQ